MIIKTKINDEGLYITGAINSAGKFENTFGLDWQADGYKFYYGNILYFETDCADNVSTVDGFLFLSVEIGGTDGTAGDSPFFPNHRPTKNESSVWPERFE